MWSRQGDLYSLVSKRKSKNGAIPEETCPRIDKLLELVEVLPVSEISAYKDLLEGLRQDNSKLRSLGIEWYKFCEELCEESDKTIKDLEGEIETLEDENRELKSNQD